MSDTREQIANRLELIAEEGQMIHCLSWSVIQAACRDAAGLLRQVAPPEGERVSVPRATIQKWIEAIEPYSIDGSYNNNGVINTVYEMGNMLLPQRKEDQHG